MRLSSTRETYPILVYLFIIICIPASWVLANEKKGNTVLTEKKINSYNAGTIQDILNQIPGVRAGESSVSIRGSYKVKVLLDGRTINDPTSSFGGVKWEAVPLKRISKIEVIKGGGSIVHGDNASGGVIIITSKQINDFSGQLQAHMGNYQTRYYFLNVEQKYGPAGLGFCSGYNKTDGFRINNDKEKKQFEAYGRYQFTPDAKINISGSHLTEERGYAGLPAYPRPNARMDYHFYSSIFSADLKNIKNKLEYTEAKKESTDPDRDLNTYLSVLKISDEITGNITTKTLDNLSIGCGLEYAKACASQFDQQEEAQYWIYGNGSYTLLNTGITFSSGLRAVYYSEFHEFLNLDGKIRYEKDNYSLQFAVTHTYNTPSFRQRFYKSSSMLPNPELTVETADNFNLSFSIDITPAFNFQFSPFYNYIQDRITYVQGSEDTGKYENFGQVSYKGFDIAVDCKLLKKVSLKTAYTYLEAKDKLTGLYLTVKSKHKASIDLLYNPIKVCSIRVSAKYASRAFTRADNSEYAPEYITANIRSEYKIKSFDLYCEIKNITNKYYIYGDGYPAPPRTWIAGIRYQF